MTLPGARWQLVPLRGGPPLPLPDGRAVVLGRGVHCELQLEDDTISRQHAELRAGPAGVSVRDLGSINGVQINGVNTSLGNAGPEDILTFGKLGFRLVGLPASLETELPKTRASGPEDLPQGTVVRLIDVQSGGGALARLQAERLTRLVSLARELSGEIEVERLLGMVVQQAAELLPVDRAALLLVDEAGELRTAHAVNRVGTGTVEVPRSIATRALDERSPISTENALDDARFKSGSVVSGQIRAALCVPLLADQERVLGVLYVDSLTSVTPFSEQDAALCFAFAGLAAVSIAKAHYAEQARKEAVARANFERFFAPAVAARIAGRQSGVRPGGERRAVTLLFSDVRGFTPLAESLAPEAVAAQLSEYFAAMVELVFEHGGTLDKFVGDALLAVWGAPVAETDDADRATAAARAMQRELVALNARWEAAGRPPLGVGIGLHHGEAFTGMIGRPRRLEYTVIGDVVNVAARLCEAARAGEVVISEEVRGRLRVPLSPGQMQPLGEPLKLRGREGAVRAYVIQEVRSEP